MAAFSIYLMGQHQPIGVDLDCGGIDDLIEQASRTKFLAGHLNEPDEDGVFRRVMIATCRIQCVIER